MLIHSNPKTKVFLTTSTQLQFLPKIAHDTPHLSLKQGVFINSHEQNRAHTARKQTRVPGGIKMEQGKEPTTVDDQAVKLKVMCTKKLRIGTRSKVRQFVDKVNEKLKSLVELEEEK